jgi:hypothetical protein
LASFPSVREGKPPVEDRAPRATVHTAPRDLRAGSLSLRKAESRSGVVACHAPVTTRVSVGGVAPHACPEGPQAVDKLRADRGTSACPPPGDFGTACGAIPCRSSGAPLHAGGPGVRATPSRRSPRPLPVRCGASRPTSRLRLAAQPDASSASRGPRSATGARRRSRCVDPGHDAWRLTTSTGAPQMPAAQRKQRVGGPPS